MAAAGIACIFSVAGNLTQLEKNCLSSRRFINQEDDFSVGTLKEVEWIKIGKSNKAFFFKGYLLASLYLNLNLETASQPSLTFFYY